MLFFGLHIMIDSLFIVIYLCQTVCLFLLEFEKLCGKSVIIKSYSTIVMNCDVFISKAPRATGPSTSTVEAKPATPQEPKKVAKASELYFRNPKSDPKLIQIEKKKVCY